jgi:hypothetical protein
MSPSIAPLTRASARRAERWPSRWAWAPVALLVALIGTQVTVLAAVLDDPTFSTEPDYYRKAVDWDAHMTRVRESQALGWSVRAQVEPPGSGSRRTPSLTLALSDRHGGPVAGARVQALAFYNARAARPLVLAPTEVTPGRYRTDFDAHHPGVWELRLTAERAGEHYEAHVRLDLARESP